MSGGEGGGGSPGRCFPHFFLSSGTLTVKKKYFFFMFGERFPSSEDTGRCRMNFPSTRCRFVVSIQNQPLSNKSSQ